MKEKVSLPVGSTLRELASEVEALPPWQKLYIASQLLQQGDRSDLAITIAENAILEYRAAKLIGWKVT